MILKFPTWEKAQGLVKQVFECGYALDDMVILTGRYEEVRAIACDLQNTFPDPLQEWEPGWVNMTIKDSQVTILATAMSYRARGLANGKTLVLLTECLPENFERGLFGPVASCVPAAEVFIPVSSEEERARVEALNTPEAAAIKEERMSSLQGKDHLNEVEMPDTRRALEDQVTKKEMLLRNTHVVVDNFDVELTEGCLKGHIKINGEPVRGVRSFVLACEAAGLPKLTLELLPAPPGAVKG